jgi:hypothetical protein
LGLLNNPRQEHFAQLVATGQSPAQAYAAAGYEEKTAYTCGPRLLKRPEVRSRVKELQQTVAQTSVSRAALSREFVVRELMDNALKAKANHEWPASNRALELLGRELNMFEESARSWSGRLEDLDPEQLDNYMASLRVLIETEEAKVEAQKQLPAAEQTVDVVPVEASEEQNK